MTKNINRSNWIFRTCSALLASGCLLAAGFSAHAQTTAANLSPDLQEIVKFAQAHMSDDVILAYIKNSGKSYNVSADDMLYLNSQGVSQAVIGALLQSKSTAAAAAAPGPVSAPAPSAPASVPPPGSTPAPMPTPVAAPVAVSALFDNFGTDPGLNNAFWTAQSPMLGGLASSYGSPQIWPRLAFGPGGMQLSGVDGPGQFTGIQSLAAYGAPFSLTATVTAQSENGVPFALYLVSADLRQWVSVTGHLGGRGHRGGDLHVGGAFGFFRGGVNVPLGGGPSPDHGVWVNYTGSGLPLPALGNKIFEHPEPGIPYTIQLTLGADGLASVAFQDAAGVTLGAQSALPAGAGPYYVVLAARNGPNFATWNSIQLTPLGPPPGAVPLVAPAVPTMDYFQAQLAPYGHWIMVDGVGSCWMPDAASDPAWRPYLDGGHWDYTDAGWYWQSDYPWGEIAFHYGRWIRDARTGYSWAWAPGYDWAPAWVCWRYSDADGCVGWAPLPWDARFDPALGIVYHGGVAVDIDFGLGFDSFVFVGRDHFWDHSYRGVMFAPDRVRLVFGHSVIHNGYRMDHGHFVADGWGRDRMAAFTHHEIVAHSAHEFRAAEEHHNLEARRVAMRDDHARPGDVRDDRGRGPAEMRPGETRGGYENSRYGASPAKAATGKTPATSHAARPANGGNNGGQNNH